MSNFSEINYEKNMQMLETAFVYSCKSYSHDEIINVLQEDNDLEKQNCLIELNHISSQKEADILVSNLTDKPGPVRETTSFKILDLISDEKYHMFFQSDYILDSFINAVTDINPSVSRNTVSIIKFVEDRTYIYNKLIEKINENIKELEKLPDNCSYDSNKIKFALYWNLEALSVVADKIETGSELYEIIDKTARVKDYTVREKTAKLISNISQNKQLITSADLLRNDENIYVRQIF